MSEVIQIDAFKAKVQTNPFPSESELYFHVEEYPLFIHSKKGEESMPVDSHKALLRRVPPYNNPHVLAVVGQGYQTIQNEELFKGIEAHMMDAFSAHHLEGAVTSNRMSYNGQQCFRDYVLPNVQVKVNEHEVAFRLLVWNGFGGSSFKLMAGGIEFFCANGMVVGDFDVFYHRHTRGLTFDKIEKKLKESIDVFYKQAELWQQWVKKDITDAQAHEFLHQQSGFSERRAQQMYRQWLLESNIRGRNVWALYSTLTYYATHNEGEFQLRETGKDHQALTLTKRELEVRKMVAGDNWRRLAA